MGAGDTSVGNEDIGRGWKGSKDGLDDVRDEMEAAVGRFLAEDGDFLDGDHSEWGRGRESDGRLMVFSCTQAKFRRGL